MVAQVVQSEPMVTSISFVIGVVDTYEEAERAVQALTEGGIPRQNIQLFHGYDGRGSMDSTGRRLHPLVNTLRYLQELLSIEGSKLDEYVEHGSVGRYVLLVDVYRHDQIKALASSLAATKAYALRFLGCWHVSDLRPRPG